MEKKKKLFLRKGFTIIEILVVICIIGILASVILVSVSSSREKAANNAAFTSIKSTAAAAYMCLTGGGSPNLNNPPVSMCSLAGYSNWPDISKNGWNYASDFRWCAPSYFGSTYPSASLCGAYNNGICGGDSATGQFCYALQKGSESKFIWCTNTGCRKSGF